jgi:hypothetical protein
MLVAGSASATGRTAGVAAVHVGGTDSAPTAFASPNPAYTVVDVALAVPAAIGIAAVGKPPNAAQALTMSSVWKPVDTPLQLIDCPDRHLSKAAHDFVWRELGDHPNTMITVLLPRRTYSPLLGRLLHDRTADKMARTVSRIRRATAIIVPHDIESRIARIAPPGNEPRNSKVVDANELQRLV